MEFQSWIIIDQKTNKNWLMLKFRNLIKINILTFFFLLVKERLYYIWLIIYLMLPYFFVLLNLILIYVAFWFIFILSKEETFLLLKVEFWKEWARGRRFWIITRCFLHCSREFKHGKTTCCVEVSIFFCFFFLFCEKRDLLQR